MVDILHTSPGQTVFKASPEGLDPEVIKAEIADLEQHRARLAAEIEKLDAEQAELEPIVVGLRAQVARRRRLGGAL